MMFHGKLIRGKQPRAWQTDLEAANERVEHARLVQRLTSDLPINSSVSIVVVDDPLSLNGGKAPAVRSLRDDPLAGMLSRGQIDNAQYMAGRKWQEYAEACEIGGVQAVDTTKEPVDGGRMREPITDRQLAAFKGMSEANARLQAEGARLIMEVLGWRVSIRAAAESRGRFTKHGWEKTGREFRGHLETLAIMWGYAQPKNAS